MTVRELRLFLADCEGSDEVVLVYPAMDPGREGTDIGMKLLAEEGLARVGGGDEVFAVLDCSDERYSREWLEEEVRKLLQPMA